MLYFRAGAPFRPEAFIMLPMEFPTNDQGAEGARLRKTYITKMPDESGAFMEACRIISAAGANITRVSYNKAVDTHTLFIDVSGAQRQLEIISAGLRELGYIQNREDNARVLLLEFLLRDVSGAVLPVLELIHSYHFNISYINSHESGGQYQHFRMGLFIDRPNAIRDFLERASRLCEIRVIDYDPGERVLDNAVFYMDFANRVAEKLHLNRSCANELMLQSNRIMQMLDERDEPPHKTFEYISRFADLLAGNRGAAFEPIVTNLPLSGGFDLTCIQPPCGSNTYILRKDDRLLFIDCGFAIYAPEMRDLLHRLYPNFDRLPREIAVTHPDMDHCGLLDWFETIHMSPLARQHFQLENSGAPNFRERNPAHAPYCAISRILSRYSPPEMNRLRVVEGPPDDPAAPLWPIGSLTFCGKRFDLYRGNGGHVPGEMILVDEAEKLVFTGDIAVNIGGFSPRQAAFNRLAPYLMTSVNVDSAAAALERRVLLERFPQSKYLYCCGHGAIWDTRAPEEDRV